MASHFYEVERGRQHLILDVFEERNIFFKQWFKNSPSILGKDSGFGREGLRYAIEEMTEPKMLVLNLA